MYRHSYALSPCSLHGSQGRSNEHALPVRIHLEHLRISVASGRNGTAVYLSMDRLGLVPNPPPPPPPPLALPALVLNTWLDLFFTVFGLGL